jgi:HD-GYP domain-containing protein (c-di-GMP phosphodiesterase class II)
MLMDLESLVILSTATGATLGLVYYAGWYLPNKLKERARQSVKAFSSAVELRFPGHHGVSTRVVGLSRLIGRRLKLTRRQLRNLETAAYLRDIGLCTVPYRLVNEKLMTAWTEEEHELYWRHPEVSAAMLEQVPSLRHLSVIVRYHHVNFDGSHGPRFPSRENIPVESRILKVAEDFVWLERRQGSQRAKERLQEMAGTEYDPRIVTAVLGMLRSNRVAERREPVAV